MMLRWRNESTRIMLDTLQIFPQRLISYFINLWEIEKNPPTAWGDPHSPQWGAIKAVFVSGTWNPIEGELFSVPFHIGLFQPVTEKKYV